MRECRICRSTDRPFKAHSGNTKKGLCLECHAAYCSEYRILKNKHLNEISDKVKVIQSLEAENAELRKKLDEAVREYKRIHQIICEGYEYHDGKSEEFLESFGVKE